MASTSKENVDCKNLYGRQGFGWLSVSHLFRSLVTIFNCESSDWIGENKSPHQRRNRSLWSSWSRDALRRPCRECPSQNVRPCCTLHPRNNLVRLWREARPNLCMPWALFAKGMSRISLPMWPMSRLERWIMSAYHKVEKSVFSSSILEGK